MLYRVHAKRTAGFRRAGRFWPASPTLVDLDEATAAILRAEPMIDIREARPEDAPDAPAPAAVASMESLTAKLEAAEKALVETRAASESDAKALIEAMGRIEDLEASLVTFKSSNATLEDRLTRAEKALVGAQEACAKLRDENKALKSKKKDAPAPEAAPSEALANEEAKPS